MGRRYEHVDYSGLLAELQSNTARKLDEEEVSENKIVMFSRKAASSNGDEYTKGILEVINDMLIYGMRKDVDYYDYVERTLDLFTDLEGNRSSFCHAVLKKMKCDDRKDLSRVITFLREIKNAISNEDNDEYDFFVERLIDKTDFCEYIYNYLNVEGSLDNSIVHPVINKEKESLVLHRIWSNEKIKYVYSNRTGMIHDKACAHVKAMSDDEIVSSEEYLSEYAQCHECELKAYIRAGAKDIKEYDAYVKLFDLMGADKNMVKHMYINLGFQTKISNMHVEGYQYAGMNNNAITVWYRDDTWRIGITDKNRVRLEHNNYKLCKKKKREFTTGFHIQSDRTYSTDLAYVLHIIKNYRFEDHFEMVSKKKPVVNNDVMVPTPENIETKKLSIRDRVVAWLRSTLFRDNLRTTRKMDDISCPDNNQMCLYLWKDENGKENWSVGKYMPKKKQFYINFDSQRILTPASKVIKWVPLTEINAR